MESNRTLFFILWSIAMSICIGGFIFALIVVPHMPSQVGEIPFNTPTSHLEFYFLHGFALATTLFFLLFGTHPHWSRHQRQFKKKWSKGHLVDSNGNLTPRGLRLYYIETGVCVILINILILSITLCSYLKQTAILPYVMLAIILPFVVGLMVYEKNFQKKSIE